MRVNIFSILLVVVIENIVSEIYESSLGENPQGFPARNAGLNLGGKGELCIPEFRSAATHIAKFVTHERRRCTHQRTGGIV